MPQSHSPEVVYVTYQGAADSRFDRDYYVNAHLPLVMKTWQPHGLLSVAAFFPALAQAGTVAICECVFRDQAAVEASFNSAEVPEIMADVPRFTDLAPNRLRAVKL